MTPLLTFTEAAERLNVTERWLRGQVTARAIPHTRIGRHVRFTEEHLRLIVAAGEAQPVRPRRRLRGVS